MNNALPLFAVLSNNSECVPFLFLAFNSFIASYLHLSDETIYTSRSLFEIKLLNETDFPLEGIVIGIKITILLDLRMSFSNLLFNSGVLYSYLIY